MHAQFVLLGESHYSRETPQLATAICRLMQPDSYAVEAGPYAAAYVNGLLKDPDRVYGYDLLVMLPEFTPANLYQ